MSGPSMQTSGQREVLKKLYDMVNCRSMNDQSKSWRGVRALGYVRIQFEEREVGAVRHGLIFDDGDFGASGWARCCSLSRASMLGQRYPLWNDAWANKFDCPPTSATKLTLSH